jgi:hypothetical protein
VPVNSDGVDAVVPFAPLPPAEGPDGVTVPLPPVVVVPVGWVALGFAPPVSAMFVLGAVEDDPVEGVPLVEVFPGSSLPPIDQFVLYSM